MTYDEALAEQVRELLAPEGPPDERRMFGGLAFLVDGSMAVAAVGGGARPFTDEAGPTDSHFNAEGHALIARWLHRELPGAIERARLP